MYDENKNIDHYVTNEKIFYAFSDLCTVSGYTDNGGRYLSSESRGLSKGEFYTP